MTETRRASGSKSARLVLYLGMGLLMLFGMAIVLGSLQLPPSRTADVGGGRLPMLIGVAIVILCALHALSVSVAQTSKPVETESPRQRIRALVLLALLLLYCGLIPLLGMLVSTAAFMMCVMLWLDTPKRWLRSAIITIVFLALIYALFTWVIGMPLP